MPGQTESLPLLSLLIFSPLVAALVAAFIKNETALRWWTLIFTSVAAVFSLQLYTGFDPANTAFQLRETVNWIPRLKEGFVESAARKRPRRANEVRVADILRPAAFTPESKKVSELFEEMQKRRIHMAIVIDEYGGTAGIVTIEDILEEIVGEIQDEYDQAEELEIQPAGENEWLINARANLGNINDALRVHFPVDEADTLGA